MMIQIFERKCVVFCIFYLCLCGVEGIIAARICENVSIRQGDLLMARKYDGQAIGMFELDSLGACYVALDAAAKTANISVQGVERNRLKSGACVKIRGGISDVKAAMEAAILAAAPYGKVTAQNVIASPGEGIDVAMEMTINK
jgi:hypothetical protein